jgi:hypothetical protein
MAMSKRVLLCVAAGLLLGSPCAVAQDQKAAGADGVQSEISMCISYYIVLKGCVADRDRNLAENTQKVMDALTERAFKLGTEIGMTGDAMLTRLKTFQDDQMQLIGRKCANISSLSARHDERCTQVAKKGDAILPGYLKK